MPLNWLRGLRGEQGVQAETTAPVEAPAEPAQAEPAPDDPPQAWAEAVCRTADKAQAGAWLARVEGEELLALVATRSRFAEVRLAAVRRISGPDVLKQVAEASREKDKHVYRHCSEALRAHRQEGVRADRAVALAAALKELLELTPVAISHLLQIEKELAALGEGGEETAECEALLEAARARVLEETQAQIALRSRLTEAEALRAAVLGWTLPAEDAAQGAADTAKLDEWHAQSLEIARIASTGPSWLAGLPAARSLAQALEEIDGRLAAYRTALDEQAAARAAQAEAATRAAQDAARKAEEEAQAAKARAAKPQRRPIDLEAVQVLVTELEQHLEAGRSTEAEAVAKKIEHAAAGAPLPGQIARRLQRARAQQARLAGWARWGTDRAREQLIGEAEALLRAEPDVDERARAVPLLRREWKNLDAHGPASQGAWKRFDRALEKAYKPVAELRAAEAAASAAARAARDALCEGWEAWVAEHAQGEPDFKALERKRAEMLGAWRAAPKAGYRDERQLRKRFDALLEKVDAPIEAARAQELERREALVAAAQALAEEADLGRAMSAAKTLQRRWKDEARLVQLRAGSDQKLWQRFRKACDAVFARRDSEQAAQEAERAVREQARQAEQQAAQALEAQKKEKHAARFARMAEQAATAPAAAADTLEQGHAQRESLLLELEIALDLPTPESHAAARRARMLARLQDRFRSGAPAQADPEKQVQAWYAIPARADEQQASRMAAIVQKLLDRPAAAKPAPAREGYARKASRS